MKVWCAHDCFKCLNVYCANLPVIEFFYLCALAIRWPHSAFAAEIIIVVVVGKSTAWLASYESPEPCAWAQSMTFQYTEPTPFTHCLKSSAFVEEADRMPLEPRSRAAESLQPPAPNVSLPKWPWRSHNHSHHGVSWNLTVPPCRCENLCGSNFICPLHRAAKKMTDRLTGSNDRKKNLWPKCLGQMWALLLMDDSIYGKASFCL